MSNKGSILIPYPLDPFGPRVGGIATFIKEFIRNAPEDFDINFIGITSDKDERFLRKWRTLKLGSKEFQFLPLFFEKDENKKSLIPLSLRFTLALWLQMPHINYSNQIIFLNRIEPGLLFLSSNNPKVAAFHNDIQKQILQNQGEVLWGKIPFLYLYIENLLIGVANHIYLVNDSSFDYYRAKYIKHKSKFTLLPSVINTTIFYPLGTSKETIRKDLQTYNLSIPITEKWILFVGRLQKQKSPFLLIDTFAEYLKKNAKSILIILGTGNLEESVKKYAEKLGISKNVYFLGQKNREELAKYYRASDIMLLVSTYEGMPFSVLEALGCGLPVVTTNTGDVKKVVKNNVSGEVVPGFDPIEIVKRLEKVLSNPNVYTKENCTNSILDYTPERALRPVYDLFRSLFNKNS